MRNIMFGNQKISINTIGEFTAKITDRKTKETVLINIDFNGVVRTFGKLVPYPKALYCVLCEYDKLGVIKL